MLCNIVDTTILALRILINVSKYKLSHDVKTEKSFFWKVENLIIHIMARKLNRWKFNYLYQGEKFHWDKSFMKSI